MNIKDFDVPIPEGDKLHLIFNHQRHLMEKYHPIEEECVGHPIPGRSYFTPEGVEVKHAGELDVQSRAGQLRFKSFAWRMTEEITEATLCLTSFNTDETHYLEEMVDALHFSVELLCMCGIEVKTLMSSRYAEDMGDSSGCLFRWSHLTDTYDIGLDSVHALLRTRSFYTIEAVGEAMNRLKLKEWKRTAMLTDEKAFRQSMIKFFYSLIDLLKVSGFNATTLTQTYLNKNAVNQFRIRSKY